MIQRFTQTLARVMPRPTVAYALMRAACSRYPLPPGEMVPLDEVEKTDRYFILHQTSLHGPIFKATAWNQFWVCIVGIPRCRRFLLDHSAHLKAETLRLESLFPKGFLRRMEGDDHRLYRKALTRGILMHDSVQHIDSLREVVLKGLAEVAAKKEDDVDGRARAYRHALSSIATGMLLQVFFGARLGTRFFEVLNSAFRKLGPHGLVWNIGQRQKEAFAEIRDAVNDELITKRGLPAGQDSIAHRISGDGLLDETMLGNLIYMVEMGRYDMAGLFRWLTKYAVEHPHHYKRVASETAATFGASGVSSDMSFAQAFVLETLRTDQSERLVRQAQRDLTFDGYLIPRHARVRLCLWESHKSEDSFADPFRFDPERFFKNTYTGEQFSPFGMDHHRCPLADVAIKTGIIFLQALAGEYSLELLADGPATRGAYHWEPAAQFAVRLLKR